MQLFLFIYFSFIANISGDTRILVSNGKEIGKFTYGSSVYSKVFDEKDYIQSIAYAYKENFVFYTNFLADRAVIKGVHLDGDKGNAPILIESTTENGFKALAVDWVTKKLYFTDMAKNRIEVCPYDGSYRRVLVSKGLDQPVAIALHPQKGYMFVADWGDRKIARYDMDGKNEFVLVNKGVNAVPYSIAIDIETNLLFYGDIGMHTIEYITIDKKNRTVLKENVQPHHMFVFKNVLFWSDPKANIYALDIHKPSNVTNHTVPELRQVPSDLVILSANIQPDVYTKCSVDNGGCSHLCLLTPTGHSCACPTGIALKADGKTCEKGMKKFLLIARKTNLRLMSLDADKSVDVVLPIKGLTRAMDVEYDILTNRVYWSDAPSLYHYTTNSDYTVNIAGTISSAYLNGTDVRNVIPFLEANSPESLAIDWNARNLYWTDPLLKRIEVSRLDGSSRKIIVAADLARPRGMAVDPGDGKIYWSDWGNLSRIECADLDGENRKVLVSKGLKWPNGITLDYQNRMLYWVDAKYRVVKKYNLNNGEIEELKSVDNHPYDITALGDYVYWTDWFRKVLRMNIHTKETKEILTGKAVSDVMGIKAVNMDPAYGSNSCFYKTNKCSHLCFHKPKLGAVCACPTRMELSNDGKSCRVPSGFLLFSLSEGIMKTSIDTFRTKHKLPLSNAGSALYQDIYFQTGRIFWLNNTHQTINAAFLNGSDMKVIVKGGLENANGLAVDWMAGNIYWLSQGRIEVAKLDGSFRKVLAYGKDMVAPAYIAVNPHISKMFWFNRGPGVANFTLWEAGLDGSSPKRLHGNISQPLCIAIDYHTNIIYWTQFNQGTGMTSLKSFDRRTNQMKSPYDNVARYSVGMVFKDKFIYADHDIGAIKEVPINGRTVMAAKILIYEDDWIHNIKAFHGSMQKGNNSCSVNNGGCSQLCFATSLTEHKCGCGTHFTLLADGKTCTAPQQFIIFTSGSLLIRLMFDSLKPEAVLPIFNDEAVSQIDYDFMRGYVYWLVAKKNVIAKSQQHGTLHEVIHLVNETDEDLSAAYDFSLDPFSNSLYWTDSLQNSINFLHLTTKANGTVYKDTKKIVHPRNIVVFPEMALMFWNDGNTNRIFKSTLAGTQPEVLILLHKDSVVRDLSLDVIQKNVYWLDSGLRRISSISIFGGEVRNHDLPKHGTNPVSMGIFSKFVFWADSSTKFIHKAWITNDSFKGDTGFHGTYPLTIDMVVVNNSRKRESHPCFINNGGCSHVCSIHYVSGIDNTKREETALCGCPLHQEAKNKTCVQSAACKENEFFCVLDGICVPESKVCDKKCDCGDCHDEKSCSYPTDCSPSLYKCGIGCFSEEQKCDKKQDCPDNEDESEDLCAPCVKGNFHCGGQMCIPLGMKCDGKPDCSDGVDEKNCQTNATTPTGFPNPQQGSNKSRLMSGIISGIVICVIVVVFVILLYVKLRNSKKNAARQQENGAMWRIEEFENKGGSVTSDDPAKSSVSTYISAVSHNTDPISYYDRNNVTGASSSVASGYTHIPYNPPPSPIALSTITETNDPYASATCEQCRNSIQETPMEEVLHDAPPPTLASTGLLEEVDLYYPIQQSHNWKPPKTVCDSCETSRSRSRKKRRSNHRPEHSYRSSLSRYPSNAPELEALYQSRETNMDDRYDQNSLFVDRQRHLLFDPPPTPCTYLSDEERPPSPAETEQSLAFSPMHRGELRPHYAPPPSPTSQL